MVMCIMRFSDGEKWGKVGNITSIWEGRPSF